MTSQDDPTSNATSASTCPSGAHSPISSSRTQSNDADSCRDRAQILQDLVVEALAGRIKIEDLTARFKVLNATAAEAEDVLAQIQQRREPHSSEERGEGTDIEESPEHRAEAAHQSAVTNNLGWLMFRAKLEQLRQLQAPSTAADAFDIMSNLFPLHTGNANQCIPQAILDAAPHLNGASQPPPDIHLAETIHLRRLFAQASDTIADSMQVRHISDPIPKSIWKDIIADKYVNFEKLFASLDPHFECDDDPKDFHAGYILVKKDQYSAKKPLHSEADWIRVFGAWLTAVKILYPHRSSELDSYYSIILEVFHECPHQPLVAILADVSIREKYAKNLFHLDDRQ